MKFIMAPAAILDFMFVQYFGTRACRTSNVIHLPNFVQICAKINELWAIDEIQNCNLRHVEFIIFVHFGQMFYFRWQPSALLQNFIHLRQSAAKLLLFVHKFKITAAAIMNYICVMLDDPRVHLCTWNSPSNFVLIECVLFEISLFKNFANLA